MPSAGLLMRRGFAQKCRHCGASKRNGYKHDKNCLANVPPAEKEFWKMGQRMQYNGTVSGVSIYPERAGKAFRMGVACTARLQVSSA